MKNKVIWIFSLFLTLNWACKEEKPLTSSIPEKLSLNYPDYFPPPYLSTDNPLTKEGVELGRYLYYDTALSNNGRSCSGCHLQDFSFSKPGTGSMPHFNLAWNKAYLWDGKIEGSMEDIMKFEVEDFFNADINKLKDNSLYKGLVKKAFGSETVTLKYLEYGLAQFFRSMVSADSKFDRIMQKKENYTQEEYNGFNLFFSEKGDCFHCHYMPMFTSGGFSNIGLDSVFNVQNQGRFGVTGNPGDLGKFKIPSLRNLSHSAPYMHDDRFKTLEEVVEHYNSGVKNSATLDPIMTKTGKATGLNLSPKEKSELVAFLKTLNDYTYINDPQFKNPFK